MLRSANPGTTSERIRTSVPVSGDYYLVVLGRNAGMHPDEPYTLSIEQATVPTASCTWTQPQPALNVQPYLADQQPLTLILYNQERLEARYGAQATADLVNALHTLAQDTNIKGYVYPVELNSAVKAAYADWNASYCSVPKANQVVETIRNALLFPILSTYPTIHYVVIVGSDEQIPFYRQSDLANVAPENTYAHARNAQHLLPAPVWHALQTRHYFTDDAYGTLSSGESAWHGRKIFIPSLAVGRLIETPAEIQGIISQYLDQPVLHSQTALVTGYDFLSDAAGATADTLDAHHTTPAQRIISNIWTRSDLINAWTQRAGGLAPSLASINAHFDHWRIQPAAGLSLVYNTDILNATASLEGEVVWSTGCHSGLNVPDAIEVIAPASPDLAQALARKKATWIGNTGYGYGTSDGIAGSERLIVLFTQHLASAPQVAVGDALQTAKQTYMSTIPAGSLTPEDLKSVSEATLYGLPMFKVHMPTAPSQARAVLDFGQTARLPSGSTLAGSAFSINEHFTRHSGESGVFYSAGDSLLNTVSNPGLPILPAVAYPLSDIPEGMLPHGAVLLSATLERQSVPNPAVTRVVTDTSLPEPTLNPDWGIYPQQVLMINQASGTPYLTAILGYFDTRNYSLYLLHNVQGQVFYAPDSVSDITPPRVLMAMARTENDGWYLQTRVVDESGVAQVWFTFFSPEGLFSVPLERDTNDPTGQRWVGRATPPATAGYMVQVVDTVGNVRQAVGDKGSYTPPEYRLFLSLVMLRK